MVNIILLLRRANPILSPQFSKAFTDFVLPLHHLFLLCYAMLPKISHSKQIRHNACFGPQDHDSSLIALY